VSAPVRDPYALGAGTEMLLRRVFSESALITALKAAPILGVDEKTLREMAAKGVIRTVIVGRNTRKFAEADIRAYLAGERDYPAWICAPCGARYGKPRGLYATFHGGDRCGWCGEITSTTEPRDYGYPSVPAGRAALQQDTRND
jgi:excisionase family DNA binding protein